MDIGFHYSSFLGKFVPNTWQGYVFWSVVPILIFVCWWIISKIRER